MARVCFSCPSCLEVFPCLANSHPHTCRLCPQQTTDPPRPHTTDVIPPPFFVNDRQVDESTPLRAWYSKVKSRPLLPETKVYPPRRSARTALPTVVNEGNFGDLRALQRVLLQRVTHLWTQTEYLLGLAKYAESDSLDFRYACHMNT